MTTERDEQGPPYLVGVTDDFPGGNDDDLTEWAFERGIEYQKWHSKPRQVTTVEELDALPIRSIVAAITHSRNVPIVIVFQRGSNWDGGDGWCTPEAIGQIPSEKVFEFIALNGLPTVFTVLTDGGSL